MSGVVPCSSYDGVVFAKLVERDVVFCAIKCVFFVVVDSVTFLA